MKHYIIVKFHNNTGDKRILYRNIDKLFSGAAQIQGVHKVSCYPSVVDYPNRYDLMILLEIEKEALSIFDQSEIHLQWKAQYSRFIESKAIFDCD